VGFGLNRAHLLWMAFTIAALGFSRSVSIGHMRQWSIP
jgi:hypothetical protein